jgi:lysophospholipase L1-like esterase
MAAKLKQYLNSQYKEYIIIKPGAKTKSIVSTQDLELKLLGKKDFLIISSGLNDLDDPSSYINEIVVPLIEFIKQHEYTNFIVVNIPHRYDFENNSCLNSINTKINRCNTKLTKLLKIHPHVSLIDTTTDRTHFTKHGFHLNNLGKEWAVTQIYKLKGSNFFYS